MKPPAPKRKAEEEHPDEPDAKKNTLIKMFAQESDAALDKRITDSIITFLADSGVAFQVVGRSSFINMIKTANRRIKLKAQTRT